MMKGVRGFFKGHKHSQETKDKISKALMKRIEFDCDMCGKKCSDTPSKYKRRKRHFCSRKCYSQFRKELLPKEEQHAYKGGGMSDKEKSIRIKARSDLNHAIRDGKLDREPCVICGDDKSEGHHEDYSKPLDVIWLCDKHHHEVHKGLHSELLEGSV